MYHLTSMATEERNYVQRMIAMGTLFILVFLSGCCTTKESVSTQIRDTVLVFIPPPFGLDTVVSGATPSGIPNPNCDTLGILAHYGSFTQTGVDSAGNFWHAKYDATNRKYEVLLQQKPQLKYLTVETNTTDTKIVKLSWIQILGYCACGAIGMLGILLVFYVVTKRI